MTKKPLIKLEGVSKHYVKNKMSVDIFDELEKEFGDTYKFTTLNVDEARDISIKYGVTSVPTFVFIKDGKVVGKETGFMHKEDLQEKIKASLG